MASEVRPYIPPENANKPPKREVLFLVGRDSAVPITPFEFMLKCFHPAKEYPPIHPEIEILPYRPESAKIAVNE